MVRCSLDPRKSCKSRGSSLCVHFKNTHETAQAIKGTTYPKSHQVSEGCHFTEATHAIPSLQWWSWQPNSGAGLRAGGPKSAEFLLHMLKNAENNAEFKGREVDSLVTEHIPVNKAPTMLAGLTELLVRSTYT